MSDKKEKKTTNSNVGSTATRDVLWIIGVKTRHRICNRLVTSQLNFFNLQERKHQNTSHKKFDIFARKNMYLLSVFLMRK